ncbi:MAG: 6-phospho-beta-glucosidase [Erysipelothrix sp.]|nr:6-phospho-beta-glucosidase [Erysipelothrix sp.]
MVKIVTIGAGSSYTPELIEGIITRYDQMPVKELWLVDIEEGLERLEIISALAKRMVKKANVDMQIFSTTDRKLALKDADFITTQFRVGQNETRYLDESLPAKFGLIGQETNGAGGLMKALRTIPVVLDIIREAKEVAPNAWIINFTNPAGMVTEAVLQHGDWKRFIGVCNVPFGMQKMVADLLNEPMDDVRIDFAGLNHMVFGLDIYLRGESVKHRVLNELMGEKSYSMKNIKDIPWSLEFIKGCNVLPCFYHRYYFQKEEMLEHLLKDYKNNNTRSEVVMKVEKSLFAKYKDETLDKKPEELQLRGGAYYSDAACNLMLGIYTDNKTIQVINTRNNGAISSLPDDVVVEVSCVITKEGPRPISMGKLPPIAQGIVSQIKAFEQQAIKAALSGTYEDALVAMVINPLVASEKIGRILLNEMLIANKKFLPQFKDAIEGIENETHS